MNVIDCARINAHISGKSSGGLESIQIGEAFLKMHYERSKRFGPTSVMVLDNVNALCAASSNEEQGRADVSQIVKVEKFVDLIRRWIEDQEV